MENNPIDISYILHIIKTFNALDIFTIIISSFALITSIKSYSHSKNVAEYNNYLKKRNNNQIQFDKYRATLNKSIKKHKEIISIFNQLTTDCIHRLTIIFSKNDNKNRLIDEHKNNELGHLFIWLVDSIVDSQEEFYSQSPVFLYSHLSSIRYINKQNYKNYKNNFISNEQSIKLYELINAVNYEHLDSMHDELILLYEKVLKFLDANKENLNNAIFKLETILDENENDEFNLCENQKLYFKYHSFLNQLNYINKLNTNIIRNKDDYSSQFLIVEITYFCISIELIRKLH